MKYLYIKQILNIYTYDFVSIKKVNYFILTILSLFFTCSVLATDKKEKTILLLDEWQCKEYVCKVAQDEQGSILFLLTDKDGVFQIYMKGKLVWERKTV